ncbi:hypothetical protein B0T11DRAFT_327622 [Plectosphaerella cucumerina]|uniref:Phytanoyl-CoA dioxygenase n=1 Tax=Plectosphaerella cucumerina TaxID=40658 RepID=A0A8K0TDG4_9PEZI|nr:hypothetical protein B0T11DRAFT_327622 [Plectosphaerella cucumerina]
MPNPPHQAGNPEITAVDVSTPINEIADIIRRDGGIIIKNFVTTDDIDQMDAESAPWFDKLRNLKYEGSLFPPSDPPLSNFAAKSHTFVHKCINHPTYRETAKALLREVSYPFRDGKRYECVSNPVLAVSEAFSRGKSAAQPLHRDDMAQHFDHVEGSGDSSLLGLLVAGTRCVYENGATQVVVGSHKWPEADQKGPADRSLCSTAEMSKGDAVFIIGSVWHGAGANQLENERRNIYSCHMTRGSYRSDENQFVGLDPEVIKSYAPEVQALMGFSVSEPFCGHVEMKDPIILLGSKEDPFGYGSFEGRPVGASVSA